MSDPVPLAPTDPAARARWARDRTVTPWVPHRVHSTTQANGTVLLRSGYDLPPHARVTGDWLQEWAQKAPYRVAVSERPQAGPGWRNVTYGELLQQVRAVAAALVGRGLTPEDRIAILSGNGLDHLILTLAAQYVGIPVAPLAEQYALMPEAQGRLRYVLGLLRPKLVFVDDTARYGAALALPDLAGVEVVALRGPHPHTPFADLLAGDPAVDIDRLHAQIGPDHLAKILFTSGSSSNPKAVPTTHRMMCVNQAQMAAVLPFLAGDGPHRITDWLPWNHVFGGSHNVNMMLAHGGTLTIDNGKPTPDLFATTLANRRDRPGTLAFNVPTGFGMIVEALRDDPQGRQHIFKDQQMLFYAGASLPQQVWEGLEQICLEARGGLPLMISSWGLTETAPACVMVHEPIGRSGVIGVPLPGVELKLIPQGEGRYEIRVRGPNVMAGYLYDAKPLDETFDAEGYFITGDAVRFVDPDDHARGLIFDGRLSEDFKLATGTWVQAGGLRLTALKALAGLAAEVVICGHDRGDVGLFIFPTQRLLAQYRPLEQGGALISAPLQAEMARRLAQMNGPATGSAKRIARALVLAHPPQIAAQEVTDKGSLNIPKILSHRADLVARLYGADDPALIRPDDAFAQG